MRHALATALLVLAFAARADNVTTEHQTTIGGRAIRYAAEAGHLTVKTGAKQPEAQMFFVAYTALPRDAKRPVTFFFNGGPGASSVWLHMGAFGPKRVPLDANGMPLDRDESRAIPNEQSLLDVTDMVFLDPVGTGLSMAAVADEAPRFHEVGMDIEITAEFIRAWLAREKRLASPLYVCGESYGTIRAAGAVDVLQRRHSLPVAGTILISPAINTEIYRIGETNLLNHVLSFPAKAATAWYHHRSAFANLTLDDVIDRASAFAKGRYWRALFDGAALPEDERTAIANEVSRFLGIPASELLLRDLRIDAFTFAGMLLRDQKKSVGVLDGRYVAHANAVPPLNFSPESSYVLLDATMAVDPVFATAFNEYLTNELKFTSADAYDMLDESIAATWDWSKRASNQYLSVTSNLRAAMTLRPRMKLFVANGYFDMVTPHLAAEYQVNQLAIPRELRNNVALHFYPSGHMMYVHDETARTLKRDLAGFYAR